MKTIIPARNWLRTASALALVTTLCACASSENEPTKTVREARVVNDDLPTAEPSDAVANEVPAPPAASRYWIDHPSAAGPSPYPEAEWSVGHGSTGELRVAESPIEMPATPHMPSYRAWNQHAIATTNAELYRAEVARHLDRTDSCVDRLGELNGWSSRVDEALWLTRCAEVHRLRAEVERRLGQYESAPVGKRAGARAALDRALVRLDRAAEPVHVEFWVRSGDAEVGLRGPWAYRPWLDRGLAGASYEDAYAYDIGVDRHLHTVDSQLDVLDTQIAEARGDDREQWLETRAELRRLRNGAERVYGRLRAGSPELWPSVRPELDDALTALDQGMETAFSGHHLEHAGFDDTALTTDFDGFEAPRLVTTFAGRSLYEERLEKDLVELEDRIDRMEDRDEFASERASAYWRADLRTARVRRSYLERRLGELQGTDDARVWASLRSDVDDTLATTAHWTSTRWDEFTAWAADAWDATTREWREVVAQNYDGWDPDAMDELTFDDRDQLATSMDEFLAEVDRRLETLDREVAELGDAVSDEQAEAVAALKRTRRRAARLRGRLEFSVRDDWADLKQDVAEHLEVIDDKLERTWDELVRG